MKSTLAAVLLLLVGVTFALPSSSGVAEKAITDLEYAWAGAQREGKADVVEPMLAEPSSIPTPTAKLPAGRRCSRT